MNYFNCIGGNDNGNFHIQYDLMDLIPSEFIEKYQNMNAKYNKLVYGLFMQ